MAAEQRKNDARPDHQQGSDLIGADLFIQQAVSKRH